MNALIYFCIFIAISYVFLLGYLFPRSESTFNVFKLRLDLFPFWMKFVSVGIFIACHVLIIVVDVYSEKWKEISIASANLSLFILLFSKEKHEDEFFEQLRYKSFTYSFLSFLASAGMFGTFDILDIKLPDKLFIIQILIGVSLAFSIIYFYYTKYRSQKNYK